MKKQMLIKKLCLILSLVSMGNVDAGVKPFGMGNAGIAYPLDSQSGALNPATMVFVGNRVDIAAGDFYQTGSSKVYGNALPANNGKFNAVTTQNYPVAELGANYMLTDCASLGLVVYNRSILIKTRYNKPFPLAGTTRLNAELIQAVIAPTVAFSFWDNHSLGLALDIGVSRGKLGGFQNLDNPLLSVAPGHVTNKGYSWGSGLGFSIGWLSKFWCDQFSIGIKYSSENYQSKSKKYKGYVPERGKLHYEPVLAGGITYKVIPELALLFDVEYHWFSEIRGLHNPVFKPDGTVGTFGSKDGSAHGYENIWVYHFGAEYTFCSGSSLRAGYMYNDALFRPKSNLGCVQSLTIPQHTASIGGTWRICPFELSFAWMHAFNRTQKGRNSISSVFGGGNVDLTQSFDIIELGVGILF